MIATDTQGISADKMSNPNALFLLADHVKLSLLERQRAHALDLGGDSQDGHISRSLDQFREGLEGLEREQKRLEEAGEDKYVSHGGPSSRSRDAVGRGDIWLDGVYVVRNADAVSPLSTARRFVSPTRCPR